MKLLLLGAVCACVYSLGLVSAVDAALISHRGGLAYYDDQLGITWAADTSINGSIDLVVQ